MSGAHSSSSDASSGRASRQLLLFVADGEPNSATASHNLQRLVDACPHVAFDVQRVNVLDDYRPALEHRVLVTPCLVQVTPRVIVVGTLRDLDSVHAALQLNEDREP